MKTKENTGASRQGQRRVDIRRTTPSQAPDPASAIQQTQWKHETSPTRDYENPLEAGETPKKNNRAVEAQRNPIEKELG